MKIILPITVLSMLMLSGCATKEYVHEYVKNQLDPVVVRVDKLEGRANAADAAIKAVDRRVDGQAGEIQSIRVDLGAQAERIARNEAAIAELTRTTQDAMDRAIAAGKLAEGKLVYEVVMTEETLKFGRNKTALSDDAKAALTEFADRLKEENKNVFIEIQGHTDSMGEAAYNLLVGERRAENVRRFLNMEAGIPLHRMSVISYGESMPVADNKLRAGRDENRRVVLVVLQ